MKNYIKKSWPFIIILLGMIQLLRLLGEVENERKTAIAQRDAALQQAEQLAKRIVELERQINPMARIQSMPEALQPED